MSICIDERYNSNKHHLKLFIYSNPEARSKFLKTFSVCFGKGHFFSISRDVALRPHNNFSWCNVSACLFRLRWIKSSSEIIPSQRARQPAWFFWRAGCIHARFTFALLLQFDHDHRCKVKVNKRTQSCSIRVIMRVISIYNFTYMRSQPYAANNIFLAKKYTCTYFYNKCLLSISLCKDQE